MSVAQEVLAVFVGAERVHCLAVLGHVDALGIDVHGAELVGIENELFHAERKAALDPSRSVEHKVHSGLHGRQQGVCRLIGRLGVGRLRRGELAARAERYADSAGEFCHDEDRESALGGTEGRCTGGHRHRGGERSEDHRSARCDELDECHARECFGERLGA